MSESNYRKLIVWQKARELARRVYRETQKFPSVEAFGLSQQMRRAVMLRALPTALYESSSPTATSSMSRTCAALGASA